MSGNSWPRLRVCFDTLLLLSPSFAADPEEVRHNNAAMIAAFAE